MKDPKITEEDLGDPQPTKKERTAWNSFLISCVAQVHRQYQNMQQYDTCPVPWVLDYQKLYCVC